MSYGWGANMFGGGFAANPDVSKITNLINVCAQLGSYTFGGNPVPAAIEVYNALKAKSPSLSIEKGDYSEDPSRNFEVMYFSGPVEVFYSGAKYSIYIKVLLPPNFPEVAPICSVINIDNTVFTVNKEYKNGLLPDETYAIDLFNAKQWSNHKNFGAVLAELTSKLGSVFPFFKSSDRSRPNPPRYYPPLLSANRLQNGGGWGNGNVFNAFGPQPGQFSGGNYGNQPYYGNQGPSPYGSNFNQQFPGTPQGNTGPSPAAVSFLTEQVNSLVLAVKADIAADKKAITQLANVRGENLALTEQYKTYYVARL